MRLLKVGATIGFAVSCRPGLKVVIADKFGLFDGSAGSFVDSVWFNILDELSGVSLRK